MHKDAYAFVREQVVKHGPFNRVLEIGSREVTSVRAVNGTPGTVRGLFGGSAYLGIDVQPGIGVDLVADGADYGDEESFDCVVCTEVLEHTREAAEIIGNSRRILRPNGWLILTCAGPGRQPHSANGEAILPRGEYYANVVPSDLHRWLRGWADVDVRYLCEYPMYGDCQVIARKLV